MNKFKSIFLGILFLSTGFAVHAEGDSKIGGVRVGYHTSALYNGDESLYETNRLDNFYLGVYKNFKIIPLLNWTAGLEYFQNGAKSSTTVGGDYKIGYLSIPIHLRVKLGPVFALAGVAANIKVSDSKSGIYNDPAQYGNTESFDLPLALGIGFKFLMFSVEARYHWGTQTINTRTDIEGATDFTTQYLQIGAAVEF